MSALKPKAEMVSEAPRECYDFDKPKNIGPLSAIKSDKLKKLSHHDNSETLEPGLKLKIQLLAEFCHSSRDMKFTDPREKFESLCFKPTTRRNLKHKVLSVRALWATMCSFLLLLLLLLLLKKRSSEVPHVPTFEEARSTVLLY